MSSPKGTLMPMCAAPWKVMLLCAVLVGGVVSLQAQDQAAFGPDSAAETYFPNSFSTSPAASGAMNSTAFVSPFSDGANQRNCAPIASGSCSGCGNDWIKCTDVFPFLTGDDSLASASPVSDTSCSTGGYLFVDYDAFRGIPDGGWENNGIRTGFNVATRLGDFSDRTGIGLQVGASVGVYDWAGTDYRMQHQGRAESQGFFTYGLYRRPTENSRITAGLVQDWSFNDTYSVFGTNATMSQLRGQIGYATSASNEFGLWGTAHVLSAVRDIPFFGPTTFQPINQLSGYWHHKWHAGGPDTWISVGVPEHSRLSGGGSLGDYLVAAAAVCPFNDAVSLSASVTYMHQSAGAGGIAAREDAWNYSVGLVIYPRCNARMPTVAGRRWMPLLPVANNGTFLVDASNTY